MEPHNAVMENTHLSTGQSCDDTNLTILTGITIQWFCLAIGGEVIGRGGNVMYLKLS